MLERIRRSQPRTPLLALPHPSIDLYCKLEHCNPTGSSKDRAAYWVLKRAIETGSITSRTTVVESSSGNFALSLAFYCRMLGMTFVPVIDPNINVSTENQLRLMCDRVEKVFEPDSLGGYLETRLRRVDEILGGLDDCYWPNQYANAAVAEAHYELTGAELCDDLVSLDAVFVAVSTAGTVAGISRRVRERFPHARVIAVDSAGSVVFGGPAATRRIPGVGSSMVPRLLDLAHIDDVVIVEERDAVAGCHALLQGYGIFAGGSTGSVFAAIERYFDGHQGPRPTAAFLSADRGLPYLDTVYDPAWVAAVYSPEARVDLPDAVATR